MRQSTTLIVLASLVATSLADTPAKTAISPADVYRLDVPQSPTLSPDGSQLAYTRAWIDDKKQERFSLWLAGNDASPTRAVEAGEPDARVPRWSPDGKRIAVVSTRPRPADGKQIPPVPAASDPAADVWLISIDGTGKALPLAGPDKPYGRVFHDGFYGGVAFSPDGKRIAFIADDGRDVRTRQEIEADVEVVRDDQGEGYTGWRPAQVWVAELTDRPGSVAATRITRLTDDDVWYGDPQWMPDGKRIVVHANKTADRESARFSVNKNFDLWSLDAVTGKAEQLTRGPGPEVFPRVSPDGSHIAFLTSPRKGTHCDTANVGLVTLGAGGSQTRVLFDHHGPGAEQAPFPEAIIRSPGSVWEWDGNKHLHIAVQAGTADPVVRVDVTTGRAEPLDPTARPRRIRELKPKGNPFLAERKVARSRIVTWLNEGFDLEGVFTEPPDGKKPYPVVVYPHGGPHGRSTPEFDFTVQVFAGAGYAVFQPNFRGSTGYGQKFIDADRGDFGGGDIGDILTGVDALIKSGDVDSSRQFVYGTSYGGFMTTWLVGQTERFKAAAAQNAVTDLNAMWGLSDLQSWTEWEFGGKPWEVPGAMRAHSPLTHAANVTTPTLILHSRDDRRCPLPMGRMYYQALKSQGVATQMVIYPNEGHGIRQPRHREDVLNRVLAWFEKHGK